MLSLIRISKYISIFLFFSSLILLVTSLNKMSNKLPVITMKADNIEKNSRQPWEFGRFIRTANFYGALKVKIPFIPNFKKTEVKNIGVNELLWDSELKDSDLIWGPLDDVVMGGASKSDLSPGDYFNGKWTGFQYNLTIYIIIIYYHYYYYYYYILYIL